MNQIKINYEYETLLYLIKKEAHGREIAKELKTSLTRVQSILSELRNDNILDYKVQGKNHIYFIKKNVIAKSHILNAENYKLAKLLRNYPLLESVTQEILKKCPNKIILLFGSYAKFISKEESDIDVYIDTTDKKIKENVEQIHEKLSVKIGKFDKEDLLIKEIIKNHIIMQGGELYYDKLGFFK